MSKVTDLLLDTLRHAENNDAEAMTNDVDPVGRALFQADAKVIDIAGDVEASGDFGGNGHGLELALVVLFHDGRSGEADADGVGTLEGVLEGGDHALARDRRTEGRRNSSLSRDIETHFERLERLALDRPVFAE